MLNKNNYMKNKELVFVLLTLVIFSVSIISAAGVSTPYWSTNPLKLGPGESLIITLGLQNMVGSDDITLRANITNGNEIARIIDTNTDYFVPLGSNNVTVNIEVNIPENAEPERTYNVQVSFVQIGSEGGGGFFTLASAFTQNIPVLVVGEPTESAVYQPVQPVQKQTNLLWIALAVIVLGIIVVALMIRRRGK